MIFALKVNLTTNPSPSKLTDFRYSGTVFTQVRDFRPSRIHVKVVAPRFKVKVTAALVFLGGGAVICFGIVEHGLRCENCGVLVLLSRSGGLE
jgi:hypothetical protein